MSQSARKPENVLQRLEWTVIRRLDGALQGDYRTLFHGFGLDLAEISEYQPGDDVRYIDWNVTARMQTPFIRRYLEDREVTAWFLLDLSPSVDFGTTQTLKRNMLIDFVTVMVRLLTRNGNRVGAMLYGAKVDQVIPARGGKIHVLRIVNDLLSRPHLSRPRLSRPHLGRPHLNSTQMTDLADLFERALRTLRRRSLVFVVSDFISLPGWQKQLTELTQKHEVLAVRLYDPKETELPDIGPVIMEDSETGEQIFLDTHDRGFRARFARNAQRREYELRTTFRRAGVDTLGLSTEADLVEEILSFATSRRQRKSRPVLAAGTIEQNSPLEGGKNVVPLD